MAHNGGDHGPSLSDVLVLLEARFLLPMPLSELSSPERLFFQLEQAMWFYNDFYSDNYSHLPSLSLEAFAKKMFEQSAVLKPLAAQGKALVDSFSAYKGQIPVFGCILLDPTLTHMVLVCSYYGKSWSFPRGKVNEGESAVQCALRETREESGFDATTLFEQQGGTVEPITLYDGGKLMQFFVVSGVPLDTIFVTQTRKEIRDIRFFPIESPPAKTWMVSPILPRLRRWISRHRARKGAKGGAGAGAGAGRKQPVVASRSAPVRSPTQVTAIPVSLLLGTATPTTSASGTPLPGRRLSVASLFEMATVAAAQQSRAHAEGDALGMAEMVGNAPYATMDGADAFARGAMYFSSGEFVFDAADIMGALDDALSHSTRRRALSTVGASAASAGAGGSASARGVASSPAVAGAS